MDREFV